MLLSLNTCGALGSVALGRVDPALNQVEIVAKAELAYRAYSAELIPKISRMLEEWGTAAHCLEAIVVVRGPGSFTGIRVGLSTAKGLAEAAGLPILAVSRLALLAGVSGFPHVLAAVDAGRGDYYLGHYRDGENLGEMLLDGAEARATVEAPGAGVLVYEESPETPAGAENLRGGMLAECNPVYLQPPSASDALRFALGRFRSADFDDVEALDGNYLRRSDAEVFGPGGRNGERHSVMR